MVMTDDAKTDLGSYTVYKGTSEIVEGVKYVIDQAMPDMAETNI